MVITEKSLYENIVPAAILIIIIILVVIPWIKKKLNHKDDRKE